MLPVFVSAAASRRDAIHHPIEADRQCFDIDRICDVGEQWANARSAQFLRCRPVAAQSKNLMSLPGQFCGERKADIAAADDENAHD